MKLNLKPYYCNPTSVRGSLWIHIVASLPLLSLLVSNVNCIESRPSEPVAANRSATQQPDRDVTDLHLTPDFRAVKLKWSYKRGEVDAAPAAFHVRYCELTSWNIEIKCRHRELRVESASAAPRFEDSTVIKAPTDTAYQLASPNSANYEAQIFDLRALTNYTFQVHVARFAHEEVERRPHRDRASGRQLVTIEQESGGNQVSSGRVETKAFSAEATRCLADVSEVLVNTGRFFGGRISVEDNTDPRCSMIGNKTSEQATYLFRIDHQTCASKIVDGNRIETMVLVHENKDILTHNTARFLVLCTFLQKSFTLKASVSLPKINSQLVGPTRPALVTALAGRLGATSNEREQQATAVMLGSMPGVYRARASTNETASPIEKSDANLVELETNTIGKLAAKTSGQASRQSKELAAELRSNPSGRARALTFTSGLPNDNGSNSNSNSHNNNDGNKFFPQPVQVQSKVLLVERASDSARVGRQQQHNGLRVKQASTFQSAAAERSSSQLDAPERPSPSVSVVVADDSKELQLQQQQQRHPKQLAELKHDELAPDLQTAPVVITNNHRIAGDYLPMSRFVSKSAGDNGFSIKYSAAQLDEYSLGRADEPPAAPPPLLLADLAAGSNPARSRAGRMHSAELNASSDLKQRNAWTVNRMGEMGESPGNLFGDANKENGNLASANSSSSFAQNITSYLLKWSLKTLTNLARKSLESLADGAEVATGESELVNQNETVSSSPHLPSTPLATSRPIVAERMDLQETRTRSPGGGARSKDLATTNEQQTGETNIQLVTVKPNASQAQTERFLDGFITGNSGRTSDKTKNDSQQKQHSRSSNYAKSLDLSRSELMSGQGKANSSDRHRPPLGSFANQSGQPLSVADSALNARSAIYPSWLIYAGPLIAVLLACILWALWLVVSPTMRGSRPMNGGAAAARSSRPVVFVDPTSPGTMFTKSGPLGTQSKSLHEGSYQKYDYNKFENCYNGTIKSATRICPQSPTSTSSQSTRSTSADENDCKNNEFLYTEHVLINTGSSFGESYA